MKFGMTDAQYEILKRLVIDPLKSQGAEVFIFGSRATGKNHPHSDVDLLYKMQGQAQISSRVLSDIKEAIEESNFPFTVEIVADQNLAASYRKNVESSMTLIS